MEALTKRQQDVLDYVKQYQSRHDRPPTQREIADNFGLYHRAIADVLRILERKNYLSLASATTRGIRLLVPNHDEIPLIGAVAAGSPIEAVENIERVVQVPPGLFRRRPDYLLRVRGDSMVDAGIHDGDWIAVRKSETAEPGEIIIAMRNGEVTVKEFSIDNGDIVLIPHNESLKPVRLPAEEVMVVGVYMNQLIRPGEESAASTRPRRIRRRA